MRILMLNYEYPPLGGGASPVTKSLSEELVKLRHSVDVVTMGFKGLKKIEEINEVNIYRVTDFRITVIFGLGKSKIINIS